MRCALWHQLLIKKMPSRLTYSPIGCPVSIDSHPSPKLYLASSQLNTSQDNSHEVVNRVTHFSPSWSKRNGNSFWPSSVVGGMFLYTPVFEQQAPSWGTAWEYWEAFRGWSLVGRNELLGWWVSWLTAHYCFQSTLCFPTVASCSFGYASHNDGLFLLQLWGILNPFLLLWLLSDSFFFFCQILFFLSKGVRNIINAQV